jgi:hypothetical protein
VIKTRTIIHTHTTDAKGGLGGIWRSTYSLSLRRSTSAPGPPRSPFSALVDRVSFTRTGYGDAPCTPSRPAVCWSPLATHQKGFPLRHKITRPMPTTDSSLPRAAAQAASASPDLRSDAPSDWPLASLRHVRGWLGPRVSGKESTMGPKNPLTNLAQKF